MWKDTLPNTAELTRQEFAEYTGYHISTIDRWLNLPACKLPHSKIGGRVYINADEGLSWMAEHGKIEKEVI